MIKIHSSRGKRRSCRYEIVAKNAQAWAFFMEKGAYTGGVQIWLRRHGEDEDRLAAEII